MKFSRKITSRELIYGVLILLALVFGGRLLLRKYLETAAQVSVAPADLSAPLVSNEKTLTNALLLSHLVFSKQTNVEMNIRIGVNLFQKKKYALARRVFEETLALDPSNASVLNNLAFMTAEEGDLNRATEWFRTAVQVAPKCAECFNNLGSVLFKSGKMDEAKKHFEQALSLRPEYVEAKLNLAVLLEGVGDWGESAKLYLESEKGIENSELKNAITQRATWMSEISQVTERAVAGERK